MSDERSPKLEYFTGRISETFWRIGRRTTPSEVMRLSSLRKPRSRPLLELASHVRCRPTRKVRPRCDSSAKLCRFSAFGTRMLSRRNRNYGSRLFQQICLACQSPCTDVSNHNGLVAWIVLHMDLAFHTYRTRGTSWHWRNEAYVLPRQVRTKSKGGFSLPFRVWRHCEWIGFPKFD